MIKTIKFGDIFSLDEKEYVYLTHNEDDDVYAARILSGEQANQINSLCNRHAGGQQKNGPHKNLTCCYVKLTSENLIGRLAHLLTAQNTIEFINYCSTGLKLNDEDKNTLKEEIVDPCVPVARELKGIIKELDI